MAIVVDRRDQTGASTGSREKFKDRQRGNIKKAIDKAISNGNVTDIGKDGIDVVVPKEDLSRPRFVPGEGGTRQRVMSGNKQFRAGDTIPKPPGGGGGGSGKGQAGQDGSGEDDFTFHLSKEEFMDYFFADLELPNLTKRSEADAKQFKMRRAGFVSQGPYSNLDMKASRKKRMGRIMGMTGESTDRILELLKLEVEILEPHDRDNAVPEKAEEWLPRKFEILALEEKLEGMKARVRHHLSADEEQELREIEDEVAELKSSIALVPSWVEANDLRFRHSEPDPIPTSKAVMFCVMDVSGSMDQETKDRAKIFYYLLHLFLTQNYEKVEHVFIRHHTEAEEVDEQEFFYGRATGGTVVSTAIELTKKIQEERYPADQWNIYGAQASDGDNWGSDDSVKSADMIHDMMPDLQGWFYTEITTRPHQNLWEAYESLVKRHADKFFMAQIKDRKDIYPVFREFFKKRDALTAGPGAKPAAFDGPEI